MSVEAMHRQAATLNVHSRYLHEGIVDFAERLTGLHDESMQSVVFACTGTEANEVTMGNVVKIRPPLVFDKAQGDAFLQAIEETLKTI